MLFRSVLSDECIVSYKVDNYYVKEAERGIKFDDKTLDIDWKINKNDAIVCERDKNFPSINKAEIFNNSESLYK